MTLHYKVLAEDGSAFHGGCGVWHLPTNSKPGKWMPKVKHVVPCESGYHVCEPGDVLSWLGPAIYTVEVRGKTVRDENKTVAQQARLIQRCEHWTERTARLFAASCARDVLHLYERDYPDDDRVRKCIEACEAFAEGTIDRIVLDAARAAARDAAGAAAWAAAWAAARDAARDAQSKRLAHLLQTGEII